MSISPHTSRLGGLFGWWPGLRWAALVEGPSSASTWGRRGVQAQRGLASVPATGEPRQGHAGQGSPATTWILDSRALRGCPCWGGGWGGDRVNVASPAPACVAPAEGTAGSHICVFCCRGLCSQEPRLPGRSGHPCADTECVGCPLNDSGESVLEKAP